MSSSDKPENPQEEQQPQSEFGSFVSSSVRSSFRQLKRQATSESESRTPRTRTSSAADETGQPIGRKWRDAIGLSRSSDEGEDEFVPDSDGAGNEGGASLRDTFFDDNGPNRNFWALLVALLVIIAIVLFFTFGGGGDNNDPDEPTPTPTSTTESVLSPDRTPSPEATENVIAPPTEEPTNEPTEDNSGGGDNVRD